MNYLQPPEINYIELNDIKVTQHLNTTQAPFEQTISYYNNLNSNVTIISRNGIPFKIPPSGSRDNNLVIRHSYRMNNNVAMDSSNIYYHNGQDTSERKAYLEAMSKYNDNATHGVKRFAVEYNISRDDIISRGGNLYVGNLDIVVSTLDDALIATHPYSDVNTRFQLIEAEVNVNDMSRFGYSIYIISNEGDYKSKYVNINGEVYKVPAVKNHSLRSGVYICSTSSSKSDSNAVMPTTIRYDYLEGEEKLKLYKTFEDAKNLGDMFIERERELLDNQLALKELDGKLNMKKSKLEKLALKQKSESSELDHERKKQSIRDKDNFESRSMHRKDSSEESKYIPAIILGIFTTIVLISKFKP